MTKIQTNLKKPCEWLHSSMAGSYWVPVEIIEEFPNSTVQIQYWDMVIEEYVLKTLPIEDIRNSQEEDFLVDSSTDHDLDLLKEYVNTAYKKTLKEVNIPGHTCPLINEIIEELKCSSDPMMADLIDKMEELRAANLQLRLVGQRFKKQANSFRYRVTKYHSSVKKASERIVLEPISEGTIPKEKIVEAVVKVKTERRRNVSK
jgi:hypothetical protein